MKKTIISLSIIGVVSAIAIGATVAYFNDTETSTGNILIAGEMDLQVDHGYAYYNGHICDGGEWKCEPWADQVVSFYQGKRKNGTPVVPERSDPSKALGEAERNDTINFVSTGFDYGVGFEGEIVLGFDNFIMNGAGDDIEVVETSFGSPSCSSYPEWAEIYASQNGSNWTFLGTICLDGTLDLGSLPWAKFVKIKDVSDPNDFPSTADGYDIDGVRAIHCATEPDLTGQPCNGSWNLTDLEDEKFFTFEDIKPGDWGKNVISFHVYDNDAWMCLLAHNKVDGENDLTDPEAEAGDTTAEEGELSGELDVFGWSDDGDGFYEPQNGETPYVDSFFDVSDDTNSMDIADSTTGTGPISPDGGLQDGTYYMGLAWCAGNLVIDNTWGFMSCDGSGMGDQAQTDSFVADLTAYAEQWRNNSDFECADVELE